jgi:hypothetical protein
MFGIICVIFIFLLSMSFLKALNVKNEADKANKRLSAQYGREQD